MPRKKDPIARILDLYAELDAPARHDVQNMMRGYDIGLKNLPELSKRAQSHLKRTPTAPTVNPTNPSEKEIQ